MEVEKALKLLSEYLGELEHLRTLHWKNQERWLWHDKVNVVIKDAFGKDSDEYRNLNPTSLITVLGLSDAEEQRDYLNDLQYYETGIKKILQKYEILGIREKPTALKYQIPGVEKEPTAMAEPPVHLFDKMHFHPKVVEASESLFKDGHYAQAIFEAFKAVNNFVKDKTNLLEDGKSLMGKAFSEKEPIIKLNELETQSEKDEQEGFKFLFMGAMVGVRNPKAHDIVVQTDPYLTLEYLGFASLLMKKIGFWETNSGQSHV